MNKFWCIFRIRDFSRTIRTIGTIFNFRSATHSNIHARSRREICARGISSWSDDVILKIVGSNRHSTKRFLLLGQFLSITQELFSNAITHRAGLFPPTGFVKFLLCTFFLFLSSLVGVLAHPIKPFPGGLFSVIENLHTCVCLTCKNLRKLGRRALVTD